MSSLRRLLVAASLAVLGVTSASAFTPAATSTTWNVTLTEGNLDGLVAESALRLATQPAASHRALADYSRWGSYLSPVYRVRGGVSQAEVFYTSEVPTGSAVQVFVRAGSSETAWQPWQELEASGARLSFSDAPGLLQLRVVLLGGEATPELSQLRLTATPATRGASSAPVGFEAAAAAPIAPTFRVFATREGLVGRRTANGHRIRPRDRFVALPNWGVLSRNGGYEYQVRITYHGRTTVVPVWDVGPWNTRDDYWGPSRKTYADLPVGLPMAQAAYHHGYNGGHDEFGRRIATPNGIDIADGAFWDDLGMRSDDWVEVSFLWLGRDPVEPGPPPEAGDAAAVVDNGRDWYDATAGDWYIGACGLNGNHNWAYSVEGEPTMSARWTGQLPQPGIYEAQAYIPACGPTASSTARYQISHDGSQTAVVVDQLAHQGRWVSLGVYHFGAKGPSQVSLSNQSDSDDRAVRFDAVKWVPRSDTTAPESRVSKVAALPDGGFLVRWEGSDDTTGIAGYDVQWRRLPDGPWTDWHIGAGIDQDRFTPPHPGDYGFRVRARDWAGNAEDWPTTPDADTIRLEEL